MKTITLDTMSKVPPCRSAFATPSGMQTRYVSMKLVMPNARDTGKRWDIISQAVLLVNLYERVSIPHRSVQNHFQYRFSSGWG